MRSVAVLSLATAALAAPSLMERAPAGCQSSFDGEFEVSVFKPAPKRDLEKRACSGKDGALLLTLKDGVLMDDKKRTGYIADNRQFQFDGPVQKGAIITSGFSVCSNGSLALGDSTVWYQCLSGDFNNIYDRHWAPQCEEVILVSKSCSEGDAGGAAGQTSDGQVQATTAVTQIGDGQVQAPTNAPVITQIGDGQIQAPSNAPVMPTGAPVSQIGDGQVQAPTSAPVASTGAPVTQIGDGQVQAPTSAPVASTGAPVTQIGDGQVQAPTSAPVATGAPVTQIGDGQVQAPTSVGTIMPTVVPSPSVSMLPPSAGSQILPGSFALIVAALGAVFAL